MAHLVLELVAQELFASLCDVSDPLRIARVVRAP